MEGKENMRDRFDIEQVLRITGLGIRADQSDGGADFDVACSIAVKKIWKAKEYEDLEEQGRLLKLPCAVGDTVYTLNHLMNGKTIIGQTRADAFMCALGMLEGRFGKTIFMSLEEAEAALKEMSE